MTNYRFVISCISLLCFTQCNNLPKIGTNASDTSFANPDTIKSVASATSLIYGEWEYNFPFYSSELTINKDGTFKFHDQGCTAETYSEGKWTMIGQLVTLTSLEKYNPEAINKPVEPKTKTSRARTKQGECDSGNKPIVLDLTSSGFDITNRSRAVYFDRQLYSLEGDTLYELNTNRRKAGNKFTLRKSIPEEAPSTFHF